MDPTPSPAPENPVETPSDKLWATTREAWQEIYLEHLRDGCTFIEAANAIGISRTTSWMWRQDPAYLARCIEAQRESLPKLEEVAYLRAVKGSDKLLMFLLQARDPAKYNLVQKVEHSGQVDMVSAILAKRKRGGTA